MAPFGQAKLAGGLVVPGSFQHHSSALSGLGAAFSFSVIRSTFDGICTVSLCFRSIMSISWVCVCGQADVATRFCCFLQHVTSATAHATPPMLKMLASGPQASPAGSAPVVFPYVGPTCCNFCFAWTEHLAVFYDTSAALRASVFMVYRMPRGRARMRGDRLDRAPQDPDKKK